jgi:ketosteroid isomerase-like protein
MLKMQSIDLQNNTETRTVQRTYMARYGSGLNWRALVHIAAIAILCACLAVGLCSTVTAGQYIDEQVIREIDSAWSQALRGKDLEKVIANYAENTSLLPPDEPIVHGRAGIQAWFAKRMTLPGYSATFAPTTIAVSKSADIAYEIGTFMATVDNESGRPVAYSGKHLVVWARVRGQWRVIAESINRDAPKERR